jgi:hypothetical protein
MEFTAGILSGYLFGCFIGGKTEGEPGRLHFEWFIQNTRVHLHHWLVFLIILIIYILSYKGNSSFIKGFLIGGITHGLTYDDWYEIIV